MATQNNYNNYIKRQKQNSTGMFRDKIKNSLGGVAVGNNTTKKPVSMMGQAPKPINPNAPKPVGNPVITTPPNNNIPKPQAGMSGYASKPTPLPRGINTPQIRPNALQSNLDPQNPITEPPIHPNQPGMPQNGQPNLPQEGMPVEGTGMMSLADINEKMKVDVEEPNIEQPVPLTVKELGQIEEMAKDPAIQAQAYAKKKTPQEMAKELFEQNKKQAQKDWEMKQKELELQNKQLQENYEQSKKDAEKSYLETNDKLSETRYQQQQDLALSGQSRGIQYSPQQLGLENVANINHNKNLAEASTKRNELLNQLSIQLGQAMANVQLGHQNSVNEYNKAMQQLTSDYQNQMINWQWDDQKTSEERKWQEAQAKADREWEKKMQEANQKWQSGENALDRKDRTSTGRSGGYYSGGGRGRSYSAYGGSNYSYTPYSSNGYGNGGYEINQIDTLDDYGQKALVKTAKEYSTDLFNEAKQGMYGDLDDRAQIFNDISKENLRLANQYGLDKRGKKELEKTRNTGIEKMWQKTYSNVTGKDYKSGGTLYKAPLVYDRKNAERNTRKLLSEKPSYDLKHSTAPVERLKAFSSKGLPNLYKPSKKSSSKKSSSKFKNKLDYKKSGLKSGSGLKNSTIKKKTYKKPTKKNIKLPKKKLGSNRDFIYKPKKKTTKKKTSWIKRLFGWK